METASSGSGPATVVSKVARYYADFASMLKASNVVEDGRLTLCDIKPVDTLRAYKR